VAIALRANIDLPGEADSARSHGAEGIGLFRTEFLVVGRSAFPPEEEQFQAYVRCSRHSRTSRSLSGPTISVGTSFRPSCTCPRRRTPSWAGERFGSASTNRISSGSQLRALVRARAHGDVRIMLPMVTQISEVVRTPELIEEITEELREEGHPVSARCQLGAMIETPAAALVAAELARHVDFISIGTNDLVQYTLAVDRGSSRLAHLYNPFHPAVVRLIDQVAKAGNAAGVEVAVCGELAAHPLGAFMLIGMGIESLSVGPIRSRRDQEGDPFGAPGTRPRCRSRGPRRRYAEEIIRILQNHLRTTSTSTASRRSPACGDPVTSQSHVRQGDTVRLEAVGAADTTWCLPPGSPLTAGGRPFRRPPCSRRGARRRNLFLPLGTICRPAGRRSVRP
jgi:hypothetical protein